MTAAQSLMIIAFMLLLVGLAVRETHKPGAHAAGALWFAGAVGFLFLSVVVHVVVQS